MSIESSVSQRLKTDVALAALVGDHIYPVNPPQDTSIPFVIYRVGGQLDASPHTKGLSGLTRANVDVEVISKYEDETIAIQEAISVLLNGVAFPGVIYCSQTGSDNTPTEPDHFDLTLSYQLFA